MWASIGFIVLFLVWFAIRSMTLGAEFGDTIVYWFVAIVICAIAFYKRKAVDKAAKTLTVASGGLEEAPKIFATSSIVLLLFIGYVSIWVTFAIDAAKVWQVYEDEHGWGCNIKHSDFGQTVHKLMGMCFFPCMLFMENAVVIISAAGIGAWYFHEDDEHVPDCPSMVGLKWAFTTSSGVSFFNAMVVNVVRKFREASESPFRFCPCALQFLFWMIFCAIQGCVLALTRYMIIAHTFHSGGIRENAQSSFQMLKDRLGDAIVNDNVSRTVLWLGTTFFSTAIGFLSFMWLDGNLEGGVLAGMKQAGEHTADQGLADVFGVYIAFIFALFISHPLLSLVVITLFADYAPPEPGMSAILGGIFIGSISNIVFTLFSVVMSSATDTIFYCFALEEDSGTKQDKHEEIYDFMKKDMLADDEASTEAGDSDVEQA